ncbi:TPA: hypothetical protein ACH3X2_004787 [Trebouxia sp. C0005]
MPPPHAEALFHLSKQWVQKVRSHVWCNRLSKLACMQSTSQLFSPSTYAPSECVIVDICDTMPCSVACDVVKTSMGHTFFSGLSAPKSLLGCFKTISCFRLLHQTSTKRFVCQSTCACKLASECTLPVAVCPVKALLSAADRPRMF